MIQKMTKFLRRDSQEVGMCVPKHPRSLSAGAKMELRLMAFFFLMGSGMFVVAETPFDLAERKFDRKKSLGLIKLNEEHLKTLAGLKKTALNNGKQEEADRIEKRIKEVKGQIITLSDSYTNRNAKDAEVEFKAKLAPFSKGKKLFTNRNYQWTEVAEDFIGFQLTLASGGAKSRDLNFTVKKRGIVRILAERADADKMKKEGWNPVGSASKQPKQYEIVYVMEKILDDGKHTLNGSDFLGLRLLLPPND